MFMKMWLNHRFQSLCHNYFFPWFNGTWGRSIHEKVNCYVIFFCIFVFFMHVIHSKIIYKLCKSVNNCIRDYCDFMAKTENVCKRFYVYKIISWQFLLLLRAAKTCEHTKAQHGNMTFVFLLSSDFSSSKLKVHEAASKVIL